MQKSIESFFKQVPATSKPAPKSSNSDDLFDEIRSQNPPEIRIKYTRQALDSLQSTSGGAETNNGEQNLEEREKLKVVGSQGNVLNKKRSYAQFHLELGQSDFLLHTCKVCGIKYAKGDDIDEKFHTTFHKNFTHGIPFKGWRQERLIDLPSLEKDRVIVVSNSDPSAQKKMVQEVVKMMEIELGDGWIFHELCKVYLYVSSQRIAGCTVVEPINSAHKVLSDSMNKISDGATRKEAVTKPTTLHFGEICFKREVSKKSSPRSGLEALDANALGSIVCEEEATPATCGVRAIWVTPFNRRKHIATHLLDAVRKSFCIDRVLDRSQLAFTQPTSRGQALASNYTESHESGLELYSMFIEHKFCIKPFTRKR